MGRQWESEMGRKILVVDDEALVRSTLEYWLTREGYDVAMADCAEDAVLLARRDRPDLVLLDIGLPDDNGFDVARALGREHMSIIFLTGRGHESDVVAGLELGAEDYVTKPFRMHELLARIRVVLRRVSRAPASAAEEALVVDDVSLDSKRRQVVVRGKRVDMPPKEFELLRLLMASAGTVLPTDYLLDAVWGDDFAGALQVLYVHIGWLREKIEVDPRRPRYIQTVRGIGYKFVGGGDAG